MSNLEKTLNALLAEALEEDALENEPEVEKAEDAGHDDGYAETGDVNKSAEEISDNIESKELTDTSVEKTVDDMEEILDNKADEDKTAEETVTEDDSFSKINALLDKINEELEMPEVKVENSDVTDDTDDKSDVYPKEDSVEEEDIPDDVDLDNDDVYPSSEEEKSEDVVTEEADVLDVKDSEDVAETLEDDHYDEDEELVDDSELERKDVYPEDEDLESEDVEDVDLDNEDIYNDETEATDEEVDSDVIQEGINPAYKNAFKDYTKNMKSMIKGRDSALKSAAKTLGASYHKENSTATVNNKDVKNAKQQIDDDFKNRQKNRTWVGRIVKRRYDKVNARKDFARTTDAYKEEEKNLNQIYNAKQDQAKKEAINASVDYTQLSDLDLMQILEDNDYETTLENLITLKEFLESGEYSIILEETTIEPSDPKEEQYDVDDEIALDDDRDSEVEPEDLKEESDDVKPEDIIDTNPEVEKAEDMPCQNLDIAGDSDEKEEDPTVKLPVENKPEDTEVKPEDLKAEPVQESVQYNSIKEACMLDEGYFYTDTYLKETAEFKQDRLVEQISLIMAREAADPLFEELLKSAAYTSRLQEACKNKYKRKALVESKKIIGENLDITGNFYLSASDINSLIDEDSLDVEGLSEFVKMLGEEHLLDEGIVSAVKGKLVSMAIGICSESLLNKIINKASTSALTKAKTPEEKKKILDLRKELLSLDKKSKKAKLRTLIKKAPEKDIAAAELKLKSAMKKQNKNSMNESFIYEDRAAWDEGKTDLENDINAIRQSWSNADSGLTNGEVDGLYNDGVAAGKGEYAKQRTWLIVAISVLTALLIAALVVIIKSNLEMY